MRMRIVIFLGWLSLFGATAHGQDSIRVRHDHDPWGACKGELLVTETGLEFRSEKEEHSHKWTWTGIQTLDRLSEQQFSVVTYDDQKWLLGRDRPYDFTVLEGEGLTDSAFDFLAGKIPRPVVDRIVRTLKQVEYEVPVKHLHTFGGCEGVLRFASDRVVYVTDHSEDARTWTLGRDLASIWSTSPFDLELVVYEREGGDLLRTRRFQFQLKEPLDQHYYDKLRRAPFTER